MLSVVIIQQTTRRHAARRHPSVGELPGNTYSPVVTLVLLNLPEAVMWPKDYPLPPAKKKLALKLHF